MGENAEKLYEFVFGDIQKMKGQTKIKTFLWCKTKLKKFHVYGFA